MNGSTGGSREDVGKLLLRLAVGVLLLFHGVSKLNHGVGWMAGPLESIGLPAFVSYGAYLGEVIAPILIILGFRARIASIFVAVDLLMAIILVLRTQIASIKQGGGGWGIELEMFFILGSLAIFFIGSGKYSITRAKNVWD